MDIKNEDISCLFFDFSNSPNRPTTDYIMKMYQQIKLVCLASLCCCICSCEDRNSEEIASKALESVTRANIDSYLALVKAMDTEKDNDAIIRDENEEKNIEGNLKQLEEVSAIKSIRQSIIKSDEYAEIQVRAVHTKGGEITQFIYMVKKNNDWLIESITQ